MFSLFKQQTRVGALFAVPIEEVEEQYHLLARGLQVQDVHETLPGERGDPDQLFLVLGLHPEQRRGLARFLLPYGVGPFAFGADAHAQHLGQDVDEVVPPTGFPGCLGNLGHEVEHPFAVSLLQQGRQDVVQGAVTAVALGVGLRKEVQKYETCV